VILGTELWQATPKTASLNQKMVQRAKGHYLVERKDGTDRTVARGPQAHVQPAGSRIHAAATDTAPQKW
jgi:hypothetical protein